MTFKECVDKILTFLRNSVVQGDRCKQTCQSFESQSYPHNLTPSGNQLLKLVLLQVYYLLVYIKTSLMLKVFIFLQNEPVSRITWTNLSLYPHIFLIVVKIIILMHCFIQYVILFDALPNFRNMYSNYYKTKTALTCYKQIHYMTEKDESIAPVSYPLKFILRRARLRKLVLIKDFFN